jgi:hypothetical protein
MSKERKNCLCTAMLYDPKDHYQPAETREFFDKKSKVLERLLRMKQRLLNALVKKEKEPKEQKPVKTEKSRSLLQLFFNL